MTTIRDIVRALDNEYSLKRAESWDKVGLLIGDANARAHRVLVAHEVTDATVDEAQKLEANALVVYHPPIFRALENLDFQNHSVRLAARCITAQIGVVAVHTALDNAPLGRALGDELASQLGLTQVRVLKASGSEALCKIVVFVPQPNLTEVQEALWSAGAGEIGHYDRASFRTLGTGTFHALLGAHPHIGEIGADASVEEWRLEVVVSESKKDACLRALIEAHPYEEVAYDIIRLENISGQSWGAARIGQLASSTRTEDFARYVQKKLRAPNVRVVRSGKDEVQTVACVPGSGASYLNAAMRSGCDVLVTGDIKHHDALQAQAHGLAVVDATHTATERAAIEMIAQALEKSSAQLGIELGVEVARSSVDTNPFETSP